MPRYNCQSNIPLAQPPMRLFALLLIALMGAAPFVSAQLRAIPPDAVKATMQPPQDGRVQMGKYVFRLAE